VGFSTDGKVFAAIASEYQTGSRMVHRWRVEKDHFAEMTPISLNIDSFTMALSSRDKVAVGGFSSGTVELYDLATGQPNGCLQYDGSENVSSLAFSPNGERLAVAFLSGRLVVWNVPASRKIECKAHEGHIWAVCFVDDQSLLTGSHDRRVKLWSLTEEGLKVKEDLGDQGGWINAVSSSADGMRLAWTGGKTHLYSRVSKKPNDLADHSAQFLVFLQERRTLVSASGDGTIRMWDLPTGQQRFAIDGGSSSLLCLASSPDDSILAAGGADGRIGIFRRGEEK
jgi:WD40 repeat protein